MQKIITKFVAHHTCAHAIYMRTYKYKYVRLRMDERV